MADDDFDDTVAITEYLDGGVDWRRVFIVADRAGIVPRESIRFVIGDDTIDVVDDDIGAVASLPRYRVASFDPARLVPFVERAINDPSYFTPAEAIAIAAACNAEASTIVDDPRSDVVLVRACGRVVCGVHRRRLVPGWRADE